MKKEKIRIVKKTHIFVLIIYPILFINRVKIVKMNVFIFCIKTP